MAEGRSRRRRRTPAEAEREILGATKRFLRRRPLRELTIDELMAETSLSRPAFYVYFQDRHDLALRLIDELGAELSGVTDRWLKGYGDLREDLRSAVEALVAAYVHHGPVLRAVADAAVDDPDVEAAYRERVDRLIEVAADHIRAQTRAGVIRGLDAKRTAAALVWMNERYLSTCLGRRHLGGRHGVRPREVVDTLYGIWLRTLYLGDPAGSAKN